MLRSTFLLFCLLAVVILTGCASRKRIMYFSDITALSKSDTTSYLQPLLIQSGDILQIVISNISRDVTALYNPLPPAVNGSAVAPGYLVDREGNVELPQMGKISVRGKSTDEVNGIIKNELEKSIKNAFVATRILNFKVSVLGDVARPGSFTISNERVSILEALGLAGDANLSAQRDEVLLIREREGKKTYVTLNLNDSKILSSPYYYLNNNDVIYVRPGVNRVISSSAVTQLLPLLATAITLLVVLYNNVK